MPVVMWMVVVIHVVVGNRGLWVVKGVMIFRSRSVLVRRSIMMVRCKMLVRMLRLSIVHVGVVMMIGIGSIIDGVVVVVSIVAWFILHISASPQIVGKGCFVKKDFQM